ncbi:hypothetical protein E4U15_007928 [Claviceps sp. LM218 group G6]|nr:hypothetical protein E4U15_007928 [Claviceps sp. LM218 group G6]
MGSGRRGLAQSRHHPLSSPEAIADQGSGTSARNTFRLRAYLVQSSAPEGVCCSEGPTSSPNGRDQMGPHGPPSPREASPVLRDRATRGPPVHREVHNDQRRLPSINSNVSGRRPKGNCQGGKRSHQIRHRGSRTRVTVHRLASGDTVVTFRDSTSRPNADETKWVQIAFGPVVVNGFPLRLSQNQDLAASIAIERVGTTPASFRLQLGRKPNGTATPAALILIIGVNSVDAANRICHLGVNVIQRG